MCGLLTLLKLSGWEQALGKLSQYRKHISFILHFIAAAYLIERFCREGENKQEIVLKAINQFIQDKKDSHGENPSQKNDAQMASLNAAVERLDAILDRLISN